MHDSNIQGCDFCYQSVYSDRKGLRFISHSDINNIYIYMCPKCGSYWEYGSDGAYIVKRSKAKELDKNRQKHKINNYFKLLFALIYIVVFYYAWATSEVFGGIVTFVSIFINSYYRN